jgi:hypothetical protein
MKNKLICEVTVDQDKTWVNFYKENKDISYTEWIEQKKYGWFK